MIDKFCSNNRIYFPELDGLRFLAFALVFLHHYNFVFTIPHLQFISSLGWAGVDLFFVLSSFLFTKLLIAEFEKNKTISFKKFYFRRIFRIWPIYFLFVTFCFILIICKHEMINKDVRIHLIGLMTFSSNITTAVKGFNIIPLADHLWTIGYEEQFYVIIPLIILILSRSSFKTKVFVFVTVFIIFNAIRLILIHLNVPWAFIYVLPFTHFESIVIGIIIGFGGGDYLFKRINPFIIGFFGVFFFFVLSWLPSIHKSSSYLLICTYNCVGISSALILYSVLNCNILVKIFSNKVLVFLGKRSYGLYIYHLLGIEIALKLNKYLPKILSNTITALFFSLSITILISIVSYKYVEKPFLIIKKKFEIIRSRPI